MPIASRPPYATDEPDSFYESPQPQRRLRQPAPANPNERSSAYDVYDNYLGNNPQQQQKKVDIQFADEKHIMRGDKEEVPLARRGERGDEFWRRFSVVAHTENRTSSSSWLKKTQNGTTRLSRWVYIIGFLLLIAAAGGIGLGWWISHNDTSHTAPEAMGGSEGQKATGNGAVVATGASSSLHVVATHTIDDRDLRAPLPTAPAAMRRAHRRKHLH